MQYTSSEAAKLLRTLNDEREALLNKEKLSSSFVAAIEEDVESLRPAYSYSETQQKLDEIEEKVRRVKHAINCFNVTQQIPELGMTIDQVLVYIPQLTAKKVKLDRMRNRLPKMRDEGGGYYSRSKTIVEYDYANYDITVVEKDYDEVADQLARVQTALDVVNNTVKFEIDI